MLKGKALLVIDRLESNHGYRWDVAVHRQSLNGEDPGDEVAEAFSCASYDVHPMPSAAYKMEVGDRIRVLVHFELDFYQSWEGEWNSELTYTRERVLRKQPYNPKKERR